MRSTDGDTGAEARSESLGPVYSDSMPRCFSSLSMRQKQEGLKFEAKQSNTARLCHRRKTNSQGQPGWQKPAIPLWEGEARLGIESCLGYLAASSSSSLAWRGKPREAAAGLLCVWSQAGLIVSQPGVDNRIPSEQTKKNSSSPVS